VPELLIPRMIQLALASRSGNMLNIFRFDDQGRLVEE
jgi:hypothetical protein